MEIKTEYVIVESLAVPRSRILFVDDRWKRIQWALSIYNKETGWELVLAPNFYEAMRALSSRDFDVVSLDHDLNGCDFQDPDSSTCGMEIVRYIQKTGWPDQRQKPAFWIHSSNLFASHLLTVSLADMGFDVCHKPIIYEVEHMTYDKDGLPK